MKVEIVCDDVLEWVTGYDGPKFHALLCDPPWEYGFMGKSWDSTGITFQSETWAALAEVLHPGAFLMVFAGSRGWHRLACALEDAGLVLQPSIFVWGLGVVEVPFCLGWLQAQAFPKANRIDRKLDERAGKLGERKEVLKPVAYPDSETWGIPNRNITGELSGWKRVKEHSPSPGMRKDTAPATPLARAWEGHRYGGQVLKDACSPLVIAFKPLTSITDCGIIVEISFLMEVLLCTLLSVQDAENLMNQVHQALLAGVDASVLGNVGCWASPKLVSIVEKLSGQSQAIIESFAAGNVLTRDVINQLGEQGALSVKDMSMSAEIASILRNIASLWSVFLADLLHPGNMSTTETVIGLTTALKILKCCLMDCIAICDIHNHNCGEELYSHACSVERNLREFVALRLKQDILTADGIATRQPVEKGSDQAANLPKNNLSPIIVAQKPWENPRLDCIVRTGAGAINVDAGRIGLQGTENHQTPGSGAIGTESGIYHSSASPHNPIQQKRAQEGLNPRYSPSGRWPSNFALVHAPGCVRAGMRRVRSPVKPHKVETNSEMGMFEGRIGTNKGLNVSTDYADPDGMEEIADWRCEPDCPARKLGEQSGIRGVSGTAKLGKVSKAGKAIFGSCDPGYERDVMPNDKGTATRYYHQSGWEHERAEMACCAEDCVCRKLDEQAGPRPGPWGGPKVAESQGGYGGFATGPCDCPKFADGEKASRYFHQSDWTHEIAERLATEAPVRYCPKAAKRERNNGLDSFFWRKDKAGPTGFVRITKEEWEALGEEEQRVKAETGKRVSLRARGNVHVAVKPISLCEWLCRLLSPPPEYAPRRLVIPFSGSGSELCAAIVSGCFEEIEAIDYIEDYCAIAKARARWWSEMLREFGSLEPSELMKKRKTGQGKLL